MHARWIAILPLAIALPAAHADDAPAYEPPEFLTATPPLPSGYDAGAAWRLDIGETLRLAVRGNLGVTLERQALRTSVLGIAVARGAFEPTLEASYVHGSSRTPPATSQEGSPGEILEFSDDRWTVSLGQRLATGMQLSASFATDRSRSTLGTAVAPLNYRSSLSVAVTQPLLRGFSTDLAIPRLAILSATLASERERRQLAVVIAEVVERAEAAYWDVVRALFRYDLDRRSLARAEEQLALTRRQIESGVLPPSDLISAESTLAQRQLALVQGEQAIQAAWDQLRAIVNLPREQWTRPILPVDVPRFLPASLSAEQALETALANRPELQQLALDLEASQLAVRRAQNDTLPQIDLGVSGTLVGQDSDHGGALGQLGTLEARGWNVFVNVTWTPLRRATSAAAEIERARHQIATVRREQVVQDIWLAVRAAVRNQDSAARQVAAAARFRALAEQSLDVEQRKFLNGTSSNFLVAQRQEELAAAQVSELAAVLDHTKAAAALARATGKLLEQRDIELTVAPR